MLGREKESLPAAFTHMDVFIVPTLLLPLGCHPPILEFQSKTPRAGCGFHMAQVGAWIYRGFIHPSCLF